MFSLKIFHTDINWMGTAQEIWIASVGFVQSFQGLHFLTLIPKGPQAKGLKTWVSGSGEWSVVLTVCFILAVCGRQWCEFPHLLLFTFISLVTFNMEDLCGEFTVITLKLIFRKINPNHLGAAKILLQNSESVSSKACCRSPLFSYLADQPTFVNQHFR